MKELCLKTSVVSARESSGCQKWRYDTRKDAFKNQRTHFDKRISAVMNDEGSLKSRDNGTQN